MRDAIFTVEELLRLDERLERVPRAQWPRLWNALRIHQWPAELGEAPNGYDDAETVHPVVRYYLEEIELRCGRKACLRYAHKVDFGVTDQEFDDWWDSRLCEPLHKQGAKYAEDRAEDGAENRDKPIMAMLTAFLFGFFSCLCAQLILRLLHLL